MIRVSNWRRLFRRPLLVLRRDDDFELLAVRELWSLLHYFVEALFEEWCSQGFNREPFFGFRELDCARSLRVCWNHSLTQGILPDEEPSEPIGVVVAVGEFGLHLSLQLLLSLSNQVSMADGDQPSWPGSSDSSFRLSIFFSSSACCFFSSNILSKTGAGVEGPELGVDDPNIVDRRSSDKPEGWSRSPVDG